MELSLNSIVNAFALMSLWEVVAVLFGIAYVILATKESLWAWFFGFVSTLIYTIIFWEGALLSSSLLNFYYMIMAGYGYYSWKKGIEEKSLSITQLTIQKNLIFIFGGFILTLILAYLSNTYTHAKMAYMDAFVMVFSILATWMLTQKILENWLYWLVVDAVAIVLYWKSGYLATVILFAIYIALSIYGYLTWRKELNEN